MKNKKIVQNIHHNLHRLNIIKKKIEYHSYDKLSENDIIFISNEIESGKITLDEVNKWMNPRK